jgi:phytoene dehydrogenase-like protein
VIIIGAGIAGLSAGCYGQMNGFRTHIFEMHDKPGGLCTSWRSGDYTVDGCLQWLVGTAPGSEFYRMWEELGAIQDREVITLEEYMRVEDGEGRSFAVYTDVSRTEEHMLELSPSDRGTVRAFAGAWRSFTKLRLSVRKAPETKNAFNRVNDCLRMLPSARQLTRWTGTSIRDFAEQFKHPLLREGFAALWYPQFSMAFLLAALAWMHKKECGFPKGGSLPFARSIELRYLNLGGDVSYGCRVNRILVEGGRAVGIRLDDGTEYRADHIVSAADGYTTVFGMLEGKHVDGKLQTQYDKLPIVPPVVHIALGANGSFDEMRPSAMGLSLPLRRPVTLAGHERRRLLLHASDSDSGLAPKGKTLLKAVLPSDYDFWKSLLEEPGRYDEEKRKILEEVVSVLGERFEGFSGRVEMRDVATPISFERYTGNWQGSIAGWMITPETWNIRRRRTLPGLENFYMAGHWVDPLGVPMAALSGRNVVQVICKAEGRRFGATAP